VAGEHEHSSESRRGSWARTPAGRALVLVAGALALGTVVGILALWPHSHTHVTNTGALGGKSLPGKVTKVISGRCPGPVAQVCRTVEVEVTGGPDRGRHTRIDLGPSRFTVSYSVGDRVRVVKNPPPPRGQPAPPNAAYSLTDYDRRMPLLWLAVALGILVLAVGRWRGLLAIVGLGGSLLVVTQFMIPAIVAGESVFAVALVGSLAAMLVTIALTSGITAQGLSAAVGIAGSLLLAAGLGRLYVSLAHLNGLSSDLALALRQSGSTVSLTGLVLAGIVIASLGVLADMAVSQASAVMALRRANPGQGFRDLYRGGFTVGRDHFAATVITLVFAYVGASLPLLLLFKTTGVGFTDAINNQEVAEPLVGILIGAMALIASVPLTTGLAALLAARMPAAALPAGAHGHAH
jgi:uncharacterized membrane protein